MLTLEQALLLAAAVGSGLIAGLCFSFASFLMRAFDNLGAPDAIRTMQSINRVILRSTAMGVWFGAVLLGIAAAVFAEEQTLAITAAALYAIGSLLVTERGNVPLNDELDRMDPEATEAAEAWTRYRVRWGRWNTIRTILCTLASGGFALAI